MPPDPVHTIEWAFLFVDGKTSFFYETIELF